MLTNVTVLSRLLGARRYAGQVLIRTVVAPLLGSNCYLVSDGDRCVVVDPGGGAADGVRAVVRTEGLAPVAILLTHGHVDHTWDAAEVSEEYRVPVRLHTADVYRLHDPLGSLGPLGPELAGMVGAPSGPPVPDRIEAFTSDGPVVPGIAAMHAPGHTEGSTVYLLDGPGGPMALTGDVLFAGTIGRCDLPGGDEQAMATTLARLAALDPHTELFPGHGPSSTMAAELVANPYLRTR